MSTNKLSKKLSSDIGDYLGEPEGCVNLAIASATSLGCMSIGHLHTLSILTGYSSSVLKAMRAEVTSDEEMEVLLEQIVLELYDGAGIAQTGASDSLNN